jgi:hypothetical protein
VPGLEALAEGVPTAEDTDLLGGIMSAYATPVERARKVTLQELLSL